MARCKICHRLKAPWRLDSYGICRKCVHSMNAQVTQSTLLVKKSKPKSNGKAIAKKMRSSMRKDIAKDKLGKDILCDIVKFGNVSNFADDVNEVMALLAYRSLSSSERPDGLAEELLRLFPDLNPKDVIATMRTKCAIASSARVKFQSLALGCKWYIWRTARDGDRVRKSHQLMEGVICNWNDPPNPQKVLDGSVGQEEHPGYAAECRCIALPVLDPDDVDLPVRVHLHGEIKKITGKKKLADILQMK